MEMRDEVLSSVGAQVMDTSADQVSDQVDVELHWEKQQRDLNAVFVSSLNTPSSPSTFNDFETG